MEYLEKVLKKTGTASLISSIIFALFGIVLIIKPTETVTAISYAFGIMFILIGLIKIINYVQNKETYNFYNYDIAYGIIAIILGVVTIVYSNQIGAFFRILIGLWIIYSSIIRVNLALKLKSIGDNVWLWSLVIAIIMLICGIYVISNSGAIIVTIGAIILTYAILDVIESCIFLGNINKLK